MKAMLGIVLIAASLTGCTRDFAEISTAQLNQAFILNSSPTSLGYDYIGSDESYHYFVTKWKYQTDKRFKVSTADLDVNKAMPLGQGTVEVFPYKPTTLDCEEFGTLGETTLFRKKELSNQRLEATGETPAPQPQG